MMTLSSVAPAMLSACPTAARTHLSAWSASITTPAFMPCIRWWPQPSRRSAPDGSQAKIRQQTLLVPASRAPISVFEPPPLLVFRIARSAASAAIARGAWLSGGDAVGAICHSAQRDPVRQTQVDDRPTVQHLLRPQHVFEPGQVLVECSGAEQDLATSAQGECPTARCNPLGDFDAPRHIGVALERSQK